MKSGCTRIRGMHVECVDIFARVVGPTRLQCAQGMVAEWRGGVQPSRVGGPSVESKTWIVFVLMGEKTYS